MVLPSKLPDPQAPVALTIAGSDSGANAGIQADLLTFAAQHVYGTSAVTCLTAQNPDAVDSFVASDATFVTQQIKSVTSYFHISAAKTGMLFNIEIIEAVADFFANNRHIKLVVDPVMVASSGKQLLQDKAVYALKNQLLPLASVITPNLDEAEILYGDELRCPDKMSRAAMELSEKWNSAILLKGGHLVGDTLYDIVCDTDGSIHTFTQERIHSIDTHGSGCTLSAAIAAQLAKGEEALSAISISRNYLRRGMEDPVHLSGRKFINHFPR